MTHEPPNTIEPQHSAEPALPGNPHAAMPGVRVRPESGGSSRAPRSRIGWSAAVCGFILLAVGLVFGQTLGHDFVNFDDDAYVYENPQVSGGVTTAGIVWALTSTHASNWHPLTWVSHMLDCQFYGLRPGGHHLTNLLLHAATAMLLFLVLLRMTGDLWPSAFVAVVFAVHPLHVESVAWVAERKDVLSGLFFMLTLAAYVRYAQSPFSWTRYLLVLALFALGLMSKSMLVTLPCVLLLLDYWPLGRLEARGLRLEETGRTSFGLRLQASSLMSPASRLLMEKIPLFAIAAGISAITLLTQQPELAMGDRFSFSSRIANAAVSYVAYLGQCCYPLGLAVFYPHPGATLPPWKVAGAVLVLAAITAAVIIWRRRCPYLLVGWLWYLGMLVPVIGLVQVASQARADRYTYLPQIGLAVALAWGAAELSRSGLSRLTGRSARLTTWITGAAAVVVIGGLMGCAWRQTSYWKNSETLWTHTLACTSNNVIAHSSFGNALFAQGRMAEALAQYEQAVDIEEQAKGCQFAPPFCNMSVIEIQQGKFGQAIAHCRRAIELQPNYGMAHSNLGVVLMRQGKVDEAMGHFERGVEVEPDNFAARANLAGALADQGKIAAAIPHFRKALELDPKFVEGYNKLGRALATEGKPEEAISLYKQALAMDPASARAHSNWASALCQLGKIDAAIPHYQQALELQPHLAEAHFGLGNVLDGQGKTHEAVSHWREAARLRPNDVEVLQRLAWTLATSPDESIRNGPKALELADRAVQLSGGRQPELLDVLAAAYAETGQFPQAIQTGSQALNLAVSHGNPVLAGAIRQRIGRYRAGVPYREAGGNP